MSKALMRGSSASHYEGQQCKSSISQRGFRGTASGIPQRLKILKILDYIDLMLLLT